VSSEHKNLVFILGPTGVGKSRISITLARDFRGEIINCDSMQVYRGFDIGTDKLAPEGWGNVRHHLLNIADPHDQFTAAQFVDAARTAAEEIWGRGRLPFVTGGTGLYVRALIHGLFPEGKKDPEIRRTLESRARRHGLEHLWESLLEVDPEYARKVGPNDRIRIVRALEVYESSGRPFSAHFPLTRPLIEGIRPIRIGLRMDRDALCARIDRRVVRMFRQGLLDEVRDLLNSGVSPEAPPFRALGYRQALRHLRGEISQDEAICLTQRATRQYAKRQMTWFRKMTGIRWFSPSEVGPIRDHIRGSLT
jgi:tRNA dimethylallyltransferase